RTLSITTSAGLTEYFAGFGVTVPPEERVVNTVAGNGTAGSSGNGGQATAAQLNEPRAVAVDQAGNVFIADSNNNKIRKVTPQGVISTFAGTGVAAFSGEGGPATNATLNRPGDIAIDSAGNVFIADSNKNRI